MALGDEKFIRFTTFKRDGTPVPTPTWIVELADGKFGFWTSSGAGKSKRLAHTARVELQPSDARGRVKPGTAPVAATAQLVAAPDAEYELIRDRIQAKYGAMTKIADVFNTVGGFLKRKRIPYADRGVVITIAN